MGKNELDADPKAIQQIEFVTQLKNIGSVNDNGIRSVFVLATLEKSRKYYEGSVMVL